MLQGISVRVKNMHGTADQVPPRLFESWLHYWRIQKRISPSNCCANDCRGGAEVGVHVCALDIGGTYIAPLCRSCNTREDSFYVPHSTLLKIR